MTASIRQLLGIGLLFVLATACRELPEKRPSIRVVYSGQADFGDVPSLLALEALQRQGYQVERLFLVGTELVIEALARGDADFGVGAIPTLWIAAARGAPVRTIMEHVASPHRLIAVADIRACADLDGRRLALHNESAASTALVRTYLAEECRSVTAPRTIFLAESENRAAALLAGQIDAAAVELSTSLWLNARSPGRFRVLSNFAERWPALKVFGVAVRREYASQHARAVRDYVAAVLGAHERIAADAALLTREATRLLGASSVWDASARAYLDARTWSTTGGMAPDDVAASLVFYKTRTNLPPTATEADVADLSFLKDVLSARRPPSQ